MTTEKKYACLDTDFLYKSHIARDINYKTLADLVLEFPDYEFCCHEMIKKELTRREIYPDPNLWLEEKISSGIIKLYSDRDIVFELKRIFGLSWAIVYLTMLRISCNTFNAGFFDQYYGSISRKNNFDNVDTFLSELSKCDDAIPHQKGLGEKKTYVLIQMLEIMHANQVFVFCSDDFKARQSVASLTKPVNCISILGVFYKLMKLGHSKSEMQVYYDKLSSFLKTQTEYKVWSLSGHQRIKVPVEQVFNDLYDHKFQMLMNGDLQYIE